MSKKNSDGTVAATKKNSGRALLSVSNKNSSDGALTVSIICRGITKGELSEAFVEKIEEWAKLPKDCGLSASPDSPSVPWDVRIGNAIWYRFLELKNVEFSPEMKLSERVYHSLVAEFVHPANEPTFFLDRFKVLSIFNRFLCGKHKINLIDSNKEILQKVIESCPPEVRTEEGFTATCNSFYAILWNRLRDNFYIFPVELSMQYVKQSLGWLCFLGSDNFYLIAHKLAQVNALFTKSCSASEVEAFVAEFVKSFMLVAKETVRICDVGKKKKKNEVKSPFYGSVCLSFTVARFMVQIKEFEKALDLSKSVLEVGGLLLDTSSVETVHKALTVYIKLAALLLWSPGKNVLLFPWDEKSLFKSGDELRQIRKLIFTSAYEKKYPGYALALTYTKMETLGITLTSFAANEPNLTPLVKVPNAVFVKFIRESYSLEEACNQLNLRNETILTEISDMKIWDHQVTFLFHILKISSDRFSDKLCEIDDEFCTVVELCYSSLLMLASKLSFAEGKKVSELYARMSQYSCTMGFGFQKRKLYQQALDWSNRSLDAYKLWVSKKEKVDVKWNSLSMALLLAECHRQLKKPMDSLRWLSKWLMIEPSRLDTAATPYDVFEQIPWTDWTTHWLQSYQDAFGSATDYKCYKTVLDFIKEDYKPKLLKQNFISKALRCELNSYFCGRLVLPYAIANVGKALLTDSECPYDNLLGYLAQCIARWWGCPDDVDRSIEIMKEAFQFMEHKTFLKKQSVEETGFVGAIVLIWRGLCRMKSLQNFVEAEMDILKAQLLLENPEKYKDKDTGEERGVSGFSMLTLDDEKAWVGDIISGINALFNFSTSAVALKQFAERFCPALVMVTCRISAYLLNAVGIQIHSAKAWHVLNELSIIYEKKGLIVLSTSEILKVVPDLNMVSVSIAEKAVKVSLDKKTVKHNLAFCQRLTLAKSLAFYNKKEYNEGLKHLEKVFTFLESRDNFDATHHVLAEATVMLSMYRSIQYAHQLDLSKFPPSLVQMSPTGLSLRAFKLLCGLTRVIEVKVSGWTDTFHNLYLLGSIVNIGTSTLKLMREAGKVKEMRCYGSDLVNFSQHAVLISRSISMIVPLIDLDIEARNFLQAQMKIDVIHDVYKRSRCLPKPEKAKPETYEKFMQNLKIPNLTVERYNRMSDLTWNLKSLDSIPSLYYKNRSSKYVANLKKDLREGFEKRDFSIPPWMQHHLSCDCYVCGINPEILPIAMKFFHVQAKYLACMTRYKNAFAVLETTKLYHEKAIFRLLFNSNQLVKPLCIIGSKQAGPAALSLIFLPFIIHPGIDALLSQMIISPTSDIKMILNAMKKCIEILDIVDPKDYTAKSYPIEIACAAISHYLDPEIEDFREKIEQAQALQEKENNASKANAESPKPTGKLPMEPAPVPKKGILKVTSKRVPPKLDLKTEDLPQMIWDDPIIPPLPQPVFDVETGNIVDEYENFGDDGTQNIPPEATVTKRALRSNVTQRRPRK